ncbi:hypothetical protein GBN33_03120 [Plesiomonas shigelloides]|uniref:hypothetical protein n=1 Tax=Plesiomonas shigelloides TaxID=703 RepID=UPI001261CF05|nr:hypothetical protein [Plesiomonas shigelloides]KAB7702105.1 hypothetical protein GBN33_03120 [Plesiomonas shigelloides]
MSATNSIDLAPIISASIAAISTILGVIAANWFNSINQEQAHEREINRNKRETKLNKSEELYLALFLWKKSISFIYMHHSRYFARALNYMQVKQLVSENTGDNGKRFDELTMLVNIYFPELKPDLEIILNIRDTLTKYLSETAPSKYKFDDFLADQKCFESACSAFLDKLASIARDL